MTYLYTTRSRVVSGHLGIEPLKMLGSDERLPLRLRLIIVKVAFQQGGW